MHEARVLEGRMVSSKSCSRVRDVDKGVTGMNGREKYHLDEGNCPQGKSMIFYQKRKETKIELVARPVAALLEVPVLGAGAGFVLGAAVTALALLLAVVFVAT